MPVEDYLDFARDRARWWWRRFPNRKDDIEGVAFLALVIAYPKINNEETAKSFLWSAINNAIMQWFADDKIIPLPRSELKRLKEANEKEQQVFLDKENLLPTLKKTRAKHEDRIRFQEIVEILDLNHQELQILHMKMDGYTNVEIAAQLGTYRQSIIRIIAKIRQRYKERF